MTTPGAAWVGLEPGSDLVKRDIPFEGELSPNEVEVKVLYCGICSSDIGCLAGLYGPMYRHPLVAGHEGAGVVTAVGNSVTGIQVGDRVGVGVYRGCCEACRFCFSGDNNCCPSKQLTFANGQRGAFGEYVRIRDKFAIPIPVEIPLKKAGPLLCAGATTFSPFRVHNIPPGSAVGVVGIGGLGHLSIQFAAKWGCRVTAISSTDSKKDIAAELGATAFIATSEEGALAAAAGTLDYIMVTAGGSGLDWGGLMAALASRGKMILMGISMDKLPLSPVQFILGEKTVVGSAAGSSENVRAMLAFAAQHGILPIIEEFAAADINAAIAKVKSGKIRFRAVVKHEHEL